VPISCTCTRVNVLEGHTEVVHVELAADVDAADIAAAWRSFGSDSVGKYPSAPAAFIQVHDDPYRPQVRLDRDAGGGMTTVIGRLRKDHTSPRGWKYILVSHNTKMGAARGCILVAENLHDQGYIGA
jgi:aspartate-semialdehyde dehydrogenase